MVSHTLPMSHQRRTPEPVLFDFELMVTSLPQNNINVAKRLFPSSIWWGCRLYQIPPTLPLTTFEIPECHFSKNPSPPELTTTYPQVL